MSKLVSCPTPECPGKATQHLLRFSHIFPIEQNSMQRIRVIGHYHTSDKQTKHSADCRLRYAPSGFYEITDTRLKGQIKAQFDAGPKADEPEQFTGFDTIGLPVDRLGYVVAIEDHEQLQAGQLLTPMEFYFMNHVAATWEEAATRAKHTEVTE